MMLKSLAAVSLVAFFAGCNNNNDNNAPSAAASADSASAPQAAAPASATVQAASVAFDAKLPASLATLTIKDAGGCFVDGIDGAPATATPVSAKTGSALTLSGWAAADVKAGTLGSALAVQLHGDKDFFAAASAERRDGLGTALGNESLDGAGLRLADTALDVPAGKYRVLVLIQSGNDLLRCDTGRSLDVL